MDAKAVKTVFFKPWCWVVALLIGLSGPWLWPVREVEVQGDLPYLDPSSVETALSGHVAWGMWWTPLSLASHALVQYPWVADVRIRRVYPDRWEVMLQPPVIVARWHEGGVVNDAGERVQLRAVLKGFEQKPLWVGPESMLPVMLVFMQGIEPMLVHFPFDLLQVRYSSLSGWTLLFSEQTTVRLPLVGGAPERFARFVQRIDRLGGAKALQGRVIDLRYRRGFSLL